MRKPEELTTAFSPTDSLEGVRSYFLVGIGGAGMSALARMLLHRGYRVEGTDSTSSPETERLTQEGIPVHIGHSGAALREGMAVVLTDAINLSISPEYERAKELGLPILRRSQALGFLLRDRKVIAVTGTHGKTTTTGLIGAGLIAAGVDPLVVVGAAIPEWGGPVREGNGEYAVVEACEAYDAFHDLSPYLVVLTNLELDHIDYHGTYENLRDSVSRFVRALPAGGHLVYCSSDPGAAEIASLVKAKEVPYSESDFPFEMALPGHHNRLNAGAALRVATTVLELDEKRAAEGIGQFRGAERRLQVLKSGPITVIDDYAHHPTEVEASLRAVRERYAGRLIVVFQPHLYSRTAPLIAEFAEALSLADLVVLTDIYPAREDPMPGVSSARISELITKPTRYIPSRHLLPREVAALAKPGDVIVGMGAGTITEFSHDVVRELEKVGSKRVAVIYGGDSSEREVSLHSGRAVHRALTEVGFISELIDVSDLLLKSGNLARFAGVDRPDVAFLAVHGTNMEDGGMQGLFELLHIPYTGSGVQASAIAMDKAATKALLETHEIRTPKGQLLGSWAEWDSFEGPWIVKPNAEGSTVGLSFVTDERSLEAAVNKALAFGEFVLVEEWIQGTEISTPVLINTALLPVEIAPTSGKYDFASKYVPGATSEIVPARLPADVLTKAQDIALAAHRALRCEGATRTDAIVRSEEIIVLEVNTLPGMTGTSLLPNSAAASGIPFGELCRRLVEDAIARHKRGA